MEDRVFKKVEGMLYRYWWKKQQIERLQKSLATVEQHIKDIRLILSEKDELYPSMGIIGKYMVIVGGQGGGAHGDPASDTYQEYIRTVEELQKELSELCQRRMKLKLRLLKLEQEIDGIEFAISYLPEIERKIVEQRYLYKRSNLQIGMALGYDEKSIRNWRKKLVYEVARLLNVV